MSNAEFTAYTLGQLDKLEPELGTEIQNRIDSMEDWWSFCSARDEINILLEANDLKPSEVALPEGYFGNNLDELYDNGYLIGCFASERMERENKPHN